MLINVALVEDQKKTLTGLSVLLNKTDCIKVTGAYLTGEKALKEIPRIMPDVTIMDIGLPDISGIEVIRKLKASLPDLKILVFTFREDRETLFTALQAGAAGYILKDAAGDEIINAVKGINNNLSHISPKVAVYLIDFFHKKTLKDSSLTDREEEILNFMATGLTYKQIAVKLLLSPDTIRTHIKNIYEKLHVHSKMEAVLKRNNGAI